MANTREKLIDVINDFFGCDAAYFDVNPFDLATHLIANGVTIQKRSTKVKPEEKHTPKKVSQETLNALNKLGQLAHTTDL